MSALAETVAALAVAAFGESRRVPVMEELPMGKSIHRQIVGVMPIVIWLSSLEQSLTTNQNNMRCWNTSSDVMMSVWTSVSFCYCYGRRDTSIRERD